MKCTASKTTTNVLLPENAYQMWRSLYSENNFCVHVTVSIHHTSIPLVLQYRQIPKCIEDRYYGIHLKLPFPWLYFGKQKSIICDSHPLSLSKRRPSISPPKGITVIIKVIIVSRFTSLLYFEGSLQIICQKSKY